MTAYDRKTKETLVQLNSVSVGESLSKMSNVRKMSLMKKNPKKTPMTDVEKY